jgi:PBP1b-binding outer membrane lipoprotein LpoB
MRLITFIFIAVFLSACGTQPANTTNTSNASNNAANSSPAAQALTVVDTPQRIKDQMATRGEQDAAQPTLKVVEPAANSTVNSSTVKLKLELSGDLKGYTPHKDPATQMGNHIHVILDNQPYEAYYELGQPFELRNVADGEHTLRVFPSRPWHESYKNNGAFQMVKFTVKNGGAEANKPATTNSGQPMSNANSNTNAAPASEGKDMQNSTAGAIDSAKPLLTYSRPKGEYKGADADPVMIDFWLANAQLKGDGGQYRIRYSVDGGEAKYIDKWAPTWLSGWTAGKHTIKLELVDEDGGLVDNGGYNSTTREITVTK